MFDTTSSERSYEMGFSGQGRWVNRTLHAFTLIELVAVIAIVSTVSAFAIPRIADIGSSDSVVSSAANAAAQSIASSLNSASSLNRINRVFKRSDAIVMTTMINVCTNAMASQLVSGVTFTAAPSSNREFAISGSATCSTPEGGKVLPCTLTGSTGATAPLQIICSG